MQDDHNLVVSSSFHTIRVSGVTAPGTLVGRPSSGSAMPWHGIRALTEGLSDRTEREAGISCPADTLAIRMAARDFRSESSDNATFDDIRPVGGRASSKRFGSRQEKGDSSDIGDLESLLLGQVILKTIRPPMGGRTVLFLAV